MGRIIVIVLVCLSVFQAVSLAQSDTLAKRSGKALPKSVQSMLNQLNDNKPAKINGVDEIEIGGLIIDESISKMGHDFYDLFYSQWIAPEVGFGYTIYIKERPVPGLGSIVSVKVNDSEVLSQRIQPRYDMIESVAEYAIRRLQTYLHNYEAIQKQLGGEDLSGSGLF